MSLTLVPITLRAANEFVAKRHRHNKPTVGCRFCVSVKNERGRVVAVAIVGRPIVPSMDDGLTAEVLRVCAFRAPTGSNSMLYAACWKAWREMGGRRMLTYTLQSESGSSLKGLKEMGWRCVATLAPRRQGWDRDDGIARKHQAVYAEAKYRWEVQR